MEEEEEVSNETYQQRVILQYLFSPSFDSRILPPYSARILNYYHPEQLPKYTENIRGNVVRFPVGTKIFSLL
jgi:hypothetical protein